MNKAYVSVGHPFSRIPFLKLTEIAYEENPEKIAKQVRKDVATNPGHFGFPRQFAGFAPGELYWAIFEEIEDEKPTLFSDNYYSGILGISQEIPLVGDSWYDTGYFDAKNGEDHRPQIGVNLKEWERGFGHYRISQANVQEVVAWEEIATPTVNYTE